MYHFLQFVCRICILLVDGKSIPGYVILHNRDARGGGAACSGARFEAITGFPGVVGAIDGMLIKIPRPWDFEGWYW
ncbi:hypothetical protein PHYSODRAFT_486684 [Phytophthora sojae]|uniref:DDE Tnp4 domain-containing protein n=1 Tax=Phytophthora sojae (strain P6497) TaxID=1094619 RepID=G4YT41_PHYSP|nr:hypothetical protein PHYSODRAFT_486684 [Phytophthora sojae]EGZ25967.1 hypothetical protein PHYSODRAFT_486684 [Phytophthora sojae]|eukprot:XP_009521255.1 hypothetical protein PHYSODRAFT_486684 [Phytophthora sojae]